MYGGVEDNALRAAELQGALKMYIAMMLIDLQDLAERLEGVLRAEDASVEELKAVLEGLRKIIGKLKVIVSDDAEMRVLEAFEAMIEGAYRSLDTLGSVRPACSSPYIMICIAIYSMGLSVAEYAYAKLRGLGLLVERLQPPRGASRRGGFFVLHC